MNRLARITIVMVAGWMGLAAALTAAGAEQSDLRGEFADPPLAWKSRPLWFWNGPLSEEKTRQMLAACKEAGYAGVGILPAEGMTPKFMTPEYLGHYRVAVEQAATLGMKICLYDEYWFPSGSAGGELAKRCPEALSKRLDMLAEDVTGPAPFARDLPEGKLMAAVAMREGTHERKDLTGLAAAGRLQWQVPEGRWKVMIFTCVHDGARGLVDYLDPDAVRRFAELTYDRYYGALGGHFGKTIDSAFYDEPTFHWVEGGRAWTPAFNEKFQKQYGVNPAVYYPALWYDIGPETAAARNALLGFRAELYAEGFPRVLDEWCRQHGIRLTGHVDQEEVVNPVGLCGDLMQAFEHQAIPGIDQIFAYGRASKAYKIVSSAACNYDRPLVMTECYGAIKDMPPANLDKEAMDQFAKGINLMVPHAVWYASPKVHFPPDLTPGAATYGEHLPQYNRYLGRLQRMLQGGRHVADIAVLYPIATLQAGYRFGVGKPYTGGVIPPEADYMDVGDRLALEVRRDFTFLHPEVLDRRCTVEGDVLCLNNDVNWEKYRVMVIPGSRTIHASSLRKIQAFYEAGGKVIATTRLPEGAAEFGKDAEVRAIVAALFGVDAIAPRYPVATASSTWAAGGYEPSCAIDGDAATRWNSAAQSGGNQWLEVDFGRTETIAGAVLREPFDRVRSYRLQYWDGAKWVDLATGQTIGESQTHSFKPLQTSRVRLVLEEIASDCVSIGELEVLDEAGRNVACLPPALACDFARCSNDRGGRTYFLPRPTAAALQAVLDDALAVPDVRFEQALRVAGGNLSYIHKAVHGNEVWFFANSSETPVDTWVRLRGKHRVEAWDPHAGEINQAEPTALSEDGCDVTRVHLRLPPVRSLFLVAPADGG